MYHVVSIFSIIEGCFALVGRFCLFNATLLFYLLTQFRYTRIFIVHFIEIFFFSIPVVAMTAFFSGAVLALQSYIGFARFNADTYIPVIVVISITRELGPVLTALMVAGRSGAGIAAEIGTMRVTDQIDALKTLSINPIQYLVVPRVLAGILALPLLVLSSDILGIFGGYLASVYNLGFSSEHYIDETVKAIEYLDVMCGVIKAIVFGFIITSIGTYNGYYCSDGAMGVGITTTKAVVSSSILILCSNYLLTALFFS